MRHPHAEATYRVVPFDNGSFAVEVSIPDTNPTKVSPFATERDAQAWIADHRSRVQSQSEIARRPFRRSGPPPRRAPAVEPGNSPAPISGEGTEPPPGETPPDNNRAI